MGPGASGRLPWAPGGFLVASWGSWTEHRRSLTAHSLVAHTDAKKFGGLGAVSYKEAHQENQAQPKENKRKSKPNQQK